jgi:hypothetical protein
MGHSEQAITEVRDFRSALRQCLSPWGDALFELCDAALCSPTPVGSVPSLSLEPEFRRSHGSLYKALAEGEVAERRLRELSGRASSEELALGVRRRRLDLGPL